MGTAIQSTAPGVQEPIQPTHFHAATSELGHLIRFLEKAAHGLEHHKGEDRTLVCMLSDQDYEIPKEVVEQPLFLKPEWVTDHVILRTFALLIEFKHKPELMLTGGTYTLFVR